jgi:predicted metalloprotease with PDZ domain
VLTLHYRYYANQPDAGGSYVQPDLIYLNPVNFLLYRPDALDAPCTLELRLPQPFRTGGALPGPGPAHAFESWHELADTPLFAAPGLESLSFEIQGVPTHCWFAGDCKPDAARLEADIRSYSEAQFSLFGVLPFREYHYLYLALPYEYRHGVEHRQSTVIAMGPGHKLMEPALYGSLLEISSHELFHAWNVKTMRPADLSPYDYGRPQYSALHYVTEGVTTYYGDLMLWKSGIWDLDRWVRSINGELEAHYRMPGHAHTSLEQSSFQSWTNGYQKGGMPNRRISFYTKGYLAALIADFLIRQATGNARSLDDAVRLMYQRFGGHPAGYTAADYRGVLEHVSGISFGSYWDRVIAGTAPLELYLQEIGAYFGLALAPAPLALPERLLGITVQAEAGKTLVEQVLPGGPAEQAGLGPGDELIAIGGRRIEGNLTEWLAYFEEEQSWELHGFRRRRLFRSTLYRGPDRTLPQFVLLGLPDAQQVRNRAAWQQLPAPEPVRP